MKKVLSVVTCSVLAACSCSDNQWEEVDSVTFDEPVYEEVVVAEPPAEVVVEEKAVYQQPNPQPAYSCPCSVQVVPCYQPVCYQPCPCMQPVMPAPQPKVTTTKKIITTTTTVEEPCGKPVCEPVVTTEEEVIPAQVSYNGYQGEAPVIMTPNQKDYVEVTVEKNPYRSEIVGMQASNSKVGSAVAAKYSPEAYSVMATRAANRMLQDTASLYDNKAATIHLKDTKLLSSDLPYGSQRLKSTMKEVISGSKTFDLVNNGNNADYIVDSSADWYVTDTSTPALQYKVAIFDKNGRKLNEWVEIIRQVQE